MLDTNVFDGIVGTPGLVDRLNRLTRTGRLAILTTPVQEQELAGMADPTRRRTAQRVERQVVPTGDAPEGAGPSAASLMPTPKHWRDAAIGATASAAADLLVTEDAGLARRLAAHPGSCRVIAFAAFLALVESLEA
jgi:predicted nucleic acid-binding protein